VRDGIPPHRGRIVTPCVPSRVRLDVRRCGRCPPKVSFLLRLYGTAVSTPTDNATSPTQSPRSAKIADGRAVARQVLHSWVCSWRWLQAERPSEARMSRSVALWNRPMSVLAAIHMRCPELCLRGRGAAGRSGVSLESDGVREIPVHSRGQRLPLKAAHVGERGGHEPERLRHPLRSGMDKPAGGEKASPGRRWTTAQCSVLGPHREKRVGRR
jgi:hypothetical protein